MSKELANSIVLAAQKMKHNEVEVISVIHYNSNSMNIFQIYYPERNGFKSFSEAYNYLAIKGYHKVSPDEDTYFKKSLEIAEGEDDPVVMVMSRKMNKEYIST
jgi:hypothetical protein